MRGLNSESLESRFKGMHSALVSYYEAGKFLPSASKGFEREVFVREFLASVLPPSYRFGTGAVIDSYNTSTGQIDIILELPLVPSFPIGPSDVRLYLAEGVGAAIEVKSDIRRSVWPKILDTTKKIKAIQQNPRFQEGKRRYLLDKVTGRIPVMVVGFKGYSSLKSLKERFERTPSDSRPDLVLTVDPLYLVTEDIAEEGASALFSFSVLLTDCCTSVTAILPPYHRYFRSETA